MKILVRSCLALAICGIFAAAVEAGPGGPSSNHQSSSSSKSATTAEKPVDTSGTYDPNAVTVTYLSTFTGGVQRVQANESGDARQIGLIRSSLQHFADNFSSADFAAMSPTHRADLPGLATLVAAPPGALHTLFVEVRGGAEVRFTSEDPGIVKAVHEWFVALQTTPSSPATAGSGSPSREPSGGAR